ncbi:MAG: sulfatase [Planctomycetaceae bacterium]|nr:sulfatase [Planctomycetaceae bacterium]
MTRLCTLLAALSALAAPAATHAAPDQQPRAAARPNIVFIMSDDHGKQAISCYGAKAAPGVVSTPGIDRLAREGMRFDRACVTNAICGPSRAVMLTSKHSHANGFARNDQRFDNTQQTFPKLLRAAGYRTEVVGKWHLESDPTGFDHWDVLVGQGDYWNPTFLVNGTRTTREGHATDLIHANALARLESLAAGAKQGTPFALLVHHKAPHRNWMPCERHLGLFAGVTIPEPSTLFLDPAARSPAGALQAMQIDRDLTWEYDLKVPFAQLFPDRKKGNLDQWMTNELARIPAGAREAVAAAYRAENEALVAAFPTMDARAQTSWKFQRYAKDYLRTAQGVDDSVGGILDALDRLDLAKDTIVVYTSDQGWYLGEYGWYDKRWMYDTSFQMPLLVRWPGVAAAGGATKALAQNLDFAPTFLEAAGIKVPADMQGESLIPILRDGDRAIAGFRPSVYYRFEESKGPHTVPRHEGVATDGAKLIRYLDLKGKDGGPLLELYVTRFDPMELTNLADDPDHEGLKEGMLAELERARARYAVPAEPAAVVAPVAAPVQGE